MRELDRAWRLRERRIAMRHARLLALLVNIHRARGAPSVSAEDFCEIDSSDETED